MNAHTNIAPINAVINLTLATPLFFPFLSIITVPSTSATGNIYAKIPKVPNCNAAKNMPTFPASPKLLINKISATASAINRAASLNAALLTFFFFFLADVERGRDVVVLVPFAPADFALVVLDDCAVLFFAAAACFDEAIIVTSIS